MYQLITSPIVAQPANNYILKLLHNNRLLYVPQNGQKSTHEVSDTKEDMMEIFHTDASGSARELKKLMGRRNYLACVAYDPDAVQGGGGLGAALGLGLGGGGTTAAPSVFSSGASLVNGGGSGSSGSGGQGLSKLSLAVDFVVQGDGGFTAPSKYGPVIVPHLEFGR